MKPCCAILAVGSIAFAFQPRAFVHETAIEPRGLVALVVGNATYGQAPLGNPINDASAMRDALSELGFAVELITNAEYKTLGKCIDRYVSRLRRGDVALFYYAG